MNLTFLKKNQRFDQLRYVIFVGNIFRIRLGVYLRLGLDRLKLH